jgi:hypothetical protein
MPSFTAQSGSLNHVLVLFAMMTFSINLAWAHFSTENLPTVCALCGQGGYP